MTAKEVTFSDNTSENSGLYGWQKPYADLYGKEVRIKMISGRTITGVLLAPRKFKGARPPRRALAIRKNGAERFRLYRIEYILSVEAIQ
ncbi:MAG: hypothetical protein QW292_07050 [Candidatus Parvarchaeota archaeon]